MPLSQRLEPKSRDIIPASTYFGSGFGFGSFLAVRQRIATMGVCLRIPHIAVSRNAPCKSPIFGVDSPIAITQEDREIRRRIRNDKCRRRRGKKKCKDLQHDGATSWQQITHTYESTLSNKQQ